MPPKPISNQEQEQQHALGRQPNAFDAPELLNFTTDLQNTFLSTLEEGREGSEMLLVRLMDAPDQRTQRNIVRPTDKVIYFGTDSTFAYTIRKASGGARPHARNSETSFAHNPAARGHYAIPEMLDQWPHDIPIESLDAKVEELNSLQRKGAFEMPPIEVQEALLETYFSLVYPAQRILDKAQCLQDFKSGSASKFLLQCLFFIGTIYCDEAVITANWESRRAAQLLFFSRAKALYDADYEQNRVTVIQGLYLMSFWWGSPTDQKDFTHWLGASIRFAQANGMHRS